MKKVLRYLLMTVMALCISLPCLSAEAASVALLPLINNVEGDQVANQVFYKNAIAALNRSKGFVMVENDKLTAAIEAANVGNEVPGESPRTAPRHCHRRTGTRQAGHPGQR